MSQTPEDEADNLERIAKACEEMAASMAIMARYMDDFIHVLAQIRDGQ